MAERERHGVSRTAKAHWTRRTARAGILSGEQRAAFEHVTDGRGLNIVVGYAGTGKSAMLGVAREAWEGAGYAMFAVRLCRASPPKVLEHGSGIASRTIASLEHAWGKAAMNCSLRAMCW
jgi:ATP-dependent exoDNAse (exonuclease V) alpha subunit